MRKLCLPEIQNQLWTILSAGTSAIYASLLVLITTRLVDLTSAGMLGYAAAVSELLRILVMFGARNYQGTDIRQEFSFNIYLCLRTLSALLASTVLVMLLILGDFDISGGLIITLFYVAYLIDMYADVFMGDFQQKGKMRIAGRMRASGFVGALVAFGFAAIITRTLVIPLIFASITIFCVYVVWIWSYRSHFGLKRSKPGLSVVLKLAFNALPIALTSTLSAYLYNAQKYYLGVLGLYDDVAVISILMLPAMVLNMFCVFFFMGAELTRVAEIYARGQTEWFYKRINQQLLFAIALFIPFMASVYFLGIPILSWLYGVDLSPYKSYLIALSSGGVFLALVAVLNSVLIVMRKQKVALLCTITVAIISGAVMWFLVSRQGIQGAAFSNLVIYAPLSVLFYISYRVAILRHVNLS